jgi:hypothetical protein
MSRSSWIMCAVHAEWAPRPACEPVGRFQRPSQPSWRRRWRPGARTAGHAATPAASRRASARTTAHCGETEMRTLFVLCLTVVTGGLAYLITIGLLHR